ncbi:ribbon-helix-helix protein, CopG family [Bosea sp. 2YAB26]|uniref:ribbon-helix-helix protein, CopG family n=1 Tax=Bosea sp. 2YAB26 TaxID=3237478 RepID=UPI003F924EDC
MESKRERIRIEILCDHELVDRLRQISTSTGASRNFLIRKAIRLYLDHRDRAMANAGST